VIRYFGGTKLGTGGLVRAYQEITKRTLELTPRAIKQLISSLDVTSEYYNYQALANFIIDLGGCIIDRKFTERVFLKVKIPFQKLDLFIEKAVNLSGGSIKVVIVVEQELNIMPITGKDNN
jgi:putative IMPACT (imprinted ancient) family translation regulator